MSKYVGISSKVLEIPPTIISLLNPLPEVLVHPTLHPVRSQTQINISLSAEHHIILIEGVVQTLVEVLQI